MLLGLALALRAPPRCIGPFMSAAPIGADGHTVDVDSAAIHARAKLGPTPDLTPAEVLETMLAAFQRGGDEDVEDLFQFVYPGGDLYQRHASPAGSMACFRWQIRREPRWQKVYARPNPDPNPNPNPNPAFGKFTAELNLFRCARMWNVLRPTLTLTLTLTPTLAF